jgi:hypothetical protein
MKVGEAIGDILKVALVCGCIYALVKWNFNATHEDEISDYAKQVCVSETGDRFETTSLKAYAVDKTNNGYVVRISVTLARGTPAKVYCLTNEHGGVEEIRIEEQ